jgi:hypothetical protein
LSVGEAVSVGVRVVRGGAPFRFLLVGEAVSVAVCSARSSSSLAFGRGRGATGPGVVRIQGICTVGDLLSVGEAVSVGVRVVRGGAPPTLGTI